VITYKPSEADRAEIQVNYNNYVHKKGWF
jgi:hypothetical protein